MTRLALLLALAGCGDNLPVPPTCDEVAAAFCDVATACFPRLPAAWCYDQELDLCAGWRPGPDCLDDTAALLCEDDALAVPCSCNPDQETCPL